MFNEPANLTSRKQVLINRIDILEGNIVSNLALANRCREKGEIARADAYLEINEQVRIIIAECRRELAEIEQQLNQIAQQKYPSVEDKEQLQELILTSITEQLTGGELDLREFLNLEKELGITDNLLQKKVVKEAKRLAKIKGVEVKFGEGESNADNIYLSLDKKDKQDNFCPNLDNLKEEYQKEFELLLAPASFPTEKLEISELLTIYFPNLEDIPETQIAERVEQSVIDKTWQIVKEKVLELISSELANNPSEEIQIKLSVSYNDDFNEYSIQAQYHPQIPFKSQLEQLIIVTPLKLEVEYLQQKQQQLPTSENFEKLAQEKKK
ncbi:21092_t:CDS:2 [Gigaspora margarita]|uniref:21092_t:CDS:1 n=1 Tax=Gigaspora margarita TaxID=4874 RepID=A0ABN7VS86_GIGMA|nr:21092_t:CDS:2 [Gigaspora margarita]